MVDIAGDRPAVVDTTAAPGEVQLGTAARYLLAGIRLALGWVFLWAFLDLSSPVSNYFSPIHLQPFYADKFGYRRGHFPVTEFISERTIALPFYNRLSEGEVGYVCEILREAVSGLKRKIKYINPIITTGRIAFPSSSRYTVHRCYR